MPVSAHAPAGAAAPPCRHAQRTARAQASSCTAQLRRGVAACPLAGPRLRDRRRGAWRSAGASVVRVFALDAALPFDYEAQARKRLDAQRSAADKLVIGASLCTASLGASSACRLLTPLCGASRHCGLRQLRSVPGQAVREAGTQGAWAALAGCGGCWLERRGAKGHPSRGAPPEPPRLLHLQVIATSRTDYRREAEDLGVTYFSDADDFVEEVRDGAGETHCAANPVRHS